MSDYNEDKKEKKGGFLSSLGRLSGSASSAAGGLGASSGGASGWLGGLLSGKTGMAGILLGSATVAAGIGVVYNFISSPDKPVYSQELFSNSYYEEEAARAGKERADARSAGVASSIDVFREQAKKDGLGLGGEASEEDLAAASAEGAQDQAGANADASVGAPGAAEGAGSGSARLVASAGFAGKSGAGGGGSSMPRMQGGSGLSGGIGGKFTSVYRPPAQASGGKVSGMTASAARVKNSPKYTVPNFNKKGAFGQAKSARNLGTQASYSKDAGARGLAGAQFDTAQQTGGGDVGAPETGTGLGGAGVSSGANLKSSDPNLSSNEVTPPKVPEPENVSPWEKTLNMVMYAMLAAAALIFIANAMAKSGTAWMIAAAQYVAWAAMAAAALVIVGALMLMTKYEQKWMGLMYTVLGGALLYMANQARVGAAQAAEQYATDQAINSQPSQAIKGQIGADSAANGGVKSAVTTQSGGTSVTYGNGATGNYSAGGYEFQPPGDSGGFCANYSTGGTTELTSGGVVSPK